CSLDQDRIFSGLDRFAGIVLAVPPQAVFAGWASGAGDRRNDVLALRHGAHAVITVPVPEVWQPAILLVPQGECADRKAVFVLNPARNVRAFGEAGWLRELETDFEFQRAIGGLRSGCGSRRGHEDRLACFVPMPV